MSIVLSTKLEYSNDANEFAKKTRLRIKCADNEDRQEKNTVHRHVCSQSPDWVLPSCIPGNVIEIIKAEKFSATFDSREP